MLLPYRSDVPIYHAPWGTGSLIALNIVLHLMHRSVDVDTLIDWWILPFGEGLTPLRWFTAAFTHGGWMHLLGNMLFLWSFGLIVEGKIGWWRFLALYAAICALVGLSEQLIMWSATRGGSLGASSAIYGLMAVSWLWAPKNVMDCLFWFGWLVRVVELPVWGVCAIFIGWDLLVAMLQQRMGTALLHVLGAFAGAPLGYLMLRKRLVDCEGWDLLSITHGSRPREDIAKALARTRAGIPEATPRDPEQVRGAALPELQAALARGDAIAALTVHERVTRQVGSWPLAAVDRKRLIDLLAQAERWDDAARQCDLARSDPALRVAATLVRVRMLIEVERRPAKAQAMLATLSGAALDQRQREQVDRLRAQAQAMIEAGVLEMMD